jgi:hypothetical protein
MKKTIRIILFIAFSTILLCGCDGTRSAEINDTTSAKTATTKIADPIATVDQNSNTNSQPLNPQVSDCVRSVPEPIVEKAVFQNTTFKLEKNKEYPYQDTGFETITFDNGDKLTIENTGCENYTLIFKFQTKSFAGDPADTKLCYKKAIELIEVAKKGIRTEDANLIGRGLRALKRYAKLTKTPRLEEDIDFGSREIRHVVALKRAKKLDKNTYEVELSFGIGPL